MIALDELASEIGDEQLVGKLELKQCENVSVMKDFSENQRICEDEPCVCIRNSSKVQKNRHEVVQEATLILEGPTKVADIIKLEQCKDIHIGNVVYVTENIVLKPEKNELEFPNRKVCDHSDCFPFIDRMHWLAQPSLCEIRPLNEPAKYVIICHTATQERFTQAENVLMLRLLQTFHIESQGWQDIGYNFCIGSDGNVYEGRGFFIEGSHTQGYNKYSFGIAFIGCFLNNLPPLQSLKKCKDLIAHGVEIGAIRPDYELLAHSQCRPFLSPGEKLMEEIRTWKNFNAEVSLQKPGISFEDD